MGYLFHRIRFEITTEELPMTDLWVNILLAILVTLATVIADWISNRVVTLTRRMAAIKRAIEKSISDKAKIEEVTQEISKYYSSQSANLIWGSDLASISFSLDLAILGVCISNPDWFPFFSRWDSPGINRTIPVWMILLFAHFLLWLISIALKHYHTDKIESLPIQTVAKFLKKGWIMQNSYLITSNAVGFVCLLSSFVIITNKI